MKYSGLERQKVGRKGLGVWQLLRRQVNVLHCQHMHLRNIFGLVVFVSFTCTNSHAVSCFGHRGNQKKTKTKTKKHENYSPIYVGNLLCDLSS